MQLTETLMLPLIVSLLTASAAAAQPQLPDALAAPGQTAVLTLHAQGEQIYECKEGDDGKLKWTFREPVATLVADGKVAGHHSAGPTWELTDGSAVVGKVVASAPGSSARDIAWLKLEVTSHKGSGKLSEVAMVQRINTVGGKLEEACERPGNTEAMPYAADYVFLRKP
jgi:hypothetical protein